MKVNQLFDFPVGVHFNQNETTNILLWAPKAQQVNLFVPGTNKKIMLQHQGFGYWWADTNEVKENDLYQFEVDGSGQFYPDPASRFQPQGVHGPSMAIDVAKYAVDNTQWQNIDLNKYIIYELHTGTFSPAGTFDGIIEKLPHLKDLGITAIEIMPVAQFAGNRNWGYDGTFPFAVQNSYGGPEGLHRLVKACHQQGIAVIIDVVYNHLGPEGNYLDVFGHYFTNKYLTPWGSALNFDDAWCDGVRDYFIENVLMWFRDYKIDALRLDAVHAIKDNSPVHILKEIKQRVDRLMEATCQRHYLIAEMDLNDTRYINALQKGGYGMDAQWVDEFHHTLRIAAGGKTTGYYEDFNGLEHLAKSLNDAYVFDGLYSHHRKKIFGIKATDNPGQQFVVFSQNHDQVGNRMLGERTSQLLSFELQKVLAAAVLCSPYLPMLFMGEEYGETNPFLYFVSHTDAALAKAVSKGRMKEFASFHAQGEAPDPNAPETFKQSKLQWQLIIKEKHAKMLSFYKALITLRNTQPALYNLNRRQANAWCNKANNTLVLKRWYAEEFIFCIFNFSDQPQTEAIGSHGKDWQVLLNSAHAQWNGLANATTITIKGGQVQLQPHSMVVCKGTML